MTRATADQAVGRPDSEGTAAPPPPPPFTPPVPPLATLILPAQPVGAPRGAWHAARARGIGASEALAALGLNKWLSPYKLWLLKTGQLPPEPAQGRMKWGIRLEPLVADWFTEITGIRTVPTGTWAHHKPLTDGTGPTLALCNPDRFTEDGVGLEIKTVHPFSEDAKTWRDEVPDYPEAQAQWSMGVTGFARWWVAAAVDGAEEPHIYEVHRDPELIGELFAAAGDLLRHYVLTGVAPPVDDSAVTAAAINVAARLNGTTGELELGAQLDELLAERKRIKAQMKALGPDLDGVESQIKALLGGHEYGLVGGARRVRYVKRHRTGYTVKSGEYMELREVTPR